MDPLADINPVLLSAGILIAVVLAELNLRWGEKSHPLTLFRLIARALGKKVTKQNRTDKQFKTSGVFAIFVLMTPIVVFAITIKWFAEYDWFFDAFFLFVALNFQTVNKKANQVNQLIKQEKRAFARNIVSSMVLRETSNLSKVGIIKASMETRILRFHYQYLTVIFWYLFTGGIGALIYRCLYELSQEWNIKQLTFRAFGKPVAWLMFIAQWIPIRFSTFFFTITLGLSSSRKAVKKLGSKFSSHSLILAVFAGALKCELGGPAFYGHKKVRLPKCGNETAPGVEDARKLGILMTQHFILLSMLIGLCYTSMFFLFQNVQNS